MRYINLENWLRREHYAFFRSWDYPHFSLCANVDITAFYRMVKRYNVSFSVATAYVLARTANDIPEFRYRIRDGAVVMHDIVHPAITVLINDDLFTFCAFQYEHDFSTFVTKAMEQIAYVKEHPLLADEPGQDNLLYMTSIPWVSFTGFMHPLNFPVDSVPRFAWGKFFEDGDRVLMPLSVQAHHALMDGFMQVAIMRACRPT